MGNLSPRVRGVLSFAIACALSAVCSSAAFAVDPPAALPTGLPDVKEYVTLTISGLGLVVAACVGGYFGFLLVIKGMRWGSRALKT